MTEWDFAAFLIGHWNDFGIPFLIAGGLWLVGRRFGFSPVHQPAMTNETSAAIAKLTEKIDAQHVEAQGARDEVSKALHSLDNRMVRIEVTLEHIKR